MKKVAIILSIIFLSCIEMKSTTLANPVKPKHKTHKHDGAPLLFWTSNRSYGPIEVFVNNVYQGDITMTYSNTPECASQGCVTVLIYGDHNVWTAQTKDGRTKWASKPVRLQDRACNSERLL